jgi:hypothetical protein
VGEQHVQCTLRHRADMPGQPADCRHMSGACPVQSCAPTVQCTECTPSPAWASVALWHCGNTLQGRWAAAHGLHLAQQYCTDGMYAPSPSSCHDVSLASQLQDYFLGLAYVFRHFVTPACHQLGVRRLPLPLQCRYELLPSDFKYFASRLDHYLPQGSCPAAASRVTGTSEPYLAKRLHTTHQQDVYVPVIAYVGVFAPLSQGCSMPRAPRG